MKFGNIESYTLLKKRKRQTKSKDIIFDFTDNKSHLFETYDYFKLKSTKKKIKEFDL